MGSIPTPPINYILNRYQAKKSIHIRNPPINFNKRLVRNLLAVASATARFAHLKMHAGDVPPECYLIKFIKYTCMSMGKRRTERP